MTTRIRRDSRLEPLDVAVDDGLMRTTLSGATPDCPQAPASRQSTHARALHRACLILGGLPRFAAHTGLAEEQLRGWMEGAGEPPEWLFLVAVEIILLDLETPSHGH
jgi:hypothetical protein